VLIRSPSKYLIAFLGLWICQYPHRSVSPPIPIPAADNESLRHTKAVACVDNNMLATQMARMRPPNIDGKRAWSKSNKDSPLRSHQHAALASHRSEI
jgi:hypothetical protein